MRIPYVWALSPSAALGFWPAGPLAPQAWPQWQCRFRAGLVPAVRLTLTISPWPSPHMPAWGGILPETDSYWLIFRLIRQFFCLIAIWGQSRNYRGKVRFAPVRTNSESQTFLRRIYNALTWVLFTGLISICEPIPGHHSPIASDAFERFAMIQDTAWIAP
jgi:hypothetical protein